MSRQEEHRIAYLTHLARTFQRNNEVGWMRPDGTIHPTELWYHCQFFIECEWALPAATEFLRPFWEAFEEPRLEEHRNSGRQWHEYVEIPMTVEAEVANEVRRIAYEAGWGRIGSYGNDKIELECFASHQRSLRRHAKEFAELVGRELTMSIIPDPEPAPTTAPTRGFTP
ncbi:hypothetical protein OIU34_23455 [Pararhizobium sp. BT-229]|uniref:hypothetical protein n=1 Tax=Pararhizobium sp. BT-229 TaxID=2986923 RepID=UPI0021F759C3|nr:hypothetical protein [Pararhizobium sp. BT-229]MCV9964854.1 hypothetical protein [Pararhizobium sp. BT-229]